MRPLFSVSSCAKISRTTREGTVVTHPRRGKLDTHQRAEEPFERKDLEKTRNRFRKGPKD